MKTEAIKYLNGLVVDETTKKEIDLIEFIKKCVREFREEEKPSNELESYINELYEKFYKIYLRKGSKEQGKKTFRKKLIKLKNEELILDKARNIAKMYSQQVNVWKKNETDKKYIPLISSWLNANVPDGK